MQHAYQIRTSIVAAMKRVKCQTVIPAYTEDGEKDMKV